VILQSSYISIRKYLEISGVPQADLEAKWILKSVLGVSDADFITGTGTVSQEQTEKIEAVAKRRVTGEPLSRIFGEKEFWGRAFKIGPDTLDPRSDTETLIRVTLEILTKKFHVKQTNDPKAAEILDLGTGSGCILVTLLAELPQSYGVGVDFSFETLKIASHNAKTHGVSQRIGLICGDWAASIDQKFDLVVSNPPYIRSSAIPELDKEVRNHDPILALDGGEDGLDAYKKIISQFPHILKPGGTALFEIGFDQADDLARLSRLPWIREFYTHTDYAGRPRVVEITNGDN
jgi:release factor glutamine methyltransferase